MKRRIGCLLLVLLLAFGCAPAAPTAEVTPIATEAPAPTEAPTPTLTPEPTPEPIGTAPIDLLSAPYNVFSGVVFPEGYTVYGARFDCAQPEKGLKDQYAQYLTVEGDKAETTRYFAGLLGVTDEAAIAKFADELERFGFTEIDGTYNGASAYVQMKQTVAGADYPECNDVDGCRAELAVEVTPAEIQLYRALTLANNNRMAFGVLTDQFPEDAIDQNLLSCYVNVQKPDRTEFYLQYQVQDATALKNEIVTRLPLFWHDEANNMWGLAYGRIRCDLRVYEDENIVQVKIRPNDNNTPASGFVLSEKSLSTLGFQYFPQDGLAIYEDKSQNIQVAIAHPDWHHVEDWNILILCDYNKHNLMFQYFEKEERFMVTAESGDHLTGSNFDLKTNSFDAGFPDAQEMQSVFEKILGSGEGDVREQILNVFTTLLQDRFGVTWQELYALPIW